MSTYDPKQIQVSFGPLALGDFAEGSMVKVSASADHFELKQGGAGATEWINKNMDIYDIEFNLLQTSPINASLSALLAADKSGNGSVYPFTVKDAGTGATSLVFIKEARIIKNPDAEYSDSTNSRTWTLKGAGAGSLVIGGN